MINRRQFLRGSAVATVGLSAGCSSNEDSDTGVKDSDGDGVVDSQDYAPRDPAVQNAPTAGPATPVDTETPTPTPEPVDTSSDSPLRVNSADLDGERSHISEYSDSEVTISLASFPEIQRREVDLVVVMATYPRDENLGSGRSETLTVPTTGTTTTTVTLETSARVPDEPLHHLLFALPPGLAMEDATADDVTFLFETDPFEMSNGTPSPTTTASSLDEANTTSYTRESMEGFYSITVDGATFGQSWTVNYIIWKSAYASASQRPRGRSYREYVAVAQDDGIAAEMASILEESARENGFTSKRNKVELAIDFVQSLPYTSDDVSTGYDQYTKTVQETITEGEGDCEDTAILLGAVLQAEPFGYDTVLINPPGHMATGIYGRDLPGYYWEYQGRRYYYIETTGTGWGVGDLPETYRGTNANVYQV